LANVLSSYNIRMTRVHIAFLRGQKGTGYIIMIQLVQNWAVARYSERRGSSQIADEMLEAAPEWGK